MKKIVCVTFVCWLLAGCAGPFQSLDLRSAANMDFVDETALDGKGGWFDDGPGDLRFFLVSRARKETPPQSVTLCGVPFRIIDPAENGGRAVVVFGSEFKPQIRLRSAGPFPVGKKVRYFYLLHASGWGKNGQTAAELRITYDDGAKAAMKIVNGIHVGDWFRPKEISGAQIAWQGFAYPGVPCGLYCCSIPNPHPAKDVKSISFQGGLDNLNYALCAVTLASDGKRIAPVGTLKQINEIPETRPEAAVSKTVNPMNFPAYSQKLQVKFASPAAAEKAKLIICPLPQGKKYALTLRWDDCNENHRNQLRIMRKNGLRGTFFLPGFEKSFVKTGRDLLRTGGCSIGNHSLKHVRYDKLSPNVIYEYVMRQQLKIESLLDTVCISYVFPGGLGNPGRDQCLAAGRALNAAGIYSGPFMSRTTHAAIGLDQRQMFPTYYFSANDRSPDEKLFREGFYKTRLLSMNDPDIPRITFGIHSWMYGADMEKLDSFYAKYFKSPEFWNATENEYAAYRYSFYNADPVRRQRSGRTAEYELKRYEPAFLGADTPLAVRFSETPQEVLLNGMRLVADAAGNFTLNHDPGKRLPAAVDALEKDGISAKFPGVAVKFSVDLQKNTAEAEFCNRSGKTLNGVFCTLILPPHWKQMNRTLAPVTVKPGEWRKWNIDLGPAEPQKKFAASQYFIPCRFDFPGGRIYRLENVQK